MLFLAGGIVGGPTPDLQQSVFVLFVVLLDFEHFEDPQVLVLAVCVHKFI